MSHASSEHTSKQPPLVLVKGIVHFERNFQNLGAFLEFMESAVEQHLKDNLAQWECGEWKEPDDHLFNGFTSFAHHCVYSLLPHRAINLWGIRLAPAVAAAEARAKKRIHKGSPLYNTSICFFVAGDFDHAYQFMAAADEENRLSGATADASLLLGNGLSGDLLVRPMAAWLHSACGSDYKAVSGHDLDEAELEQMLRWLSIRMPDALQCVVALHRLVKVQTPPHNEASQHIRVRALAELCIVLESATRRWNVACTEELHKQLESVLSASTIALAEFRRLHVAYTAAYPRPSNKSPAAVILDAIAEDKTLVPAAKGLALKLLRRVNWWRVAGTVAKAGAGFAVAGPAGLGLAVGSDFATLGKDLVKKAEDFKEEDLTKYLAESPEHEERRSVREFRDDFAKLLSQTKRKRLVVVIDDLDRCLPETIIETLEAIKLFLFVDRTAFIIGADERLVKYAVRRRFPELPGERTEVGRDYLEKLIQFPIRIPPLGRLETESYVSLLFALRSVGAESFAEMRKAAIECDPATLHSLRFTADVATKVLGKVEGDFAEDLYLAERIAPILAAETIGNPRQCKRFMNMLSIRLAMAKSRGVTDLKPRVLAKLMLLEYYRTESFRQLAAAQAEEDGKPQALANAEKRSREETITRSHPAPARANAGGKAPAAATPDEEETPDLPLWLLDPWVIAWAKSEPALAGVDLRPYLYFSRDTLGPMGQAIQRMTPAAQEVFKKVLSQSDAERKMGFTRASSLSPADASAVFEALAGRIREDDDFGSESSAFGRAIDWVKERRELVGQLAALLASVPEDRVPPATPIKLVELGSKSATDPIAKLFAQWQRSSTLALKNATEMAMKRLA